MEEILFNTDENRYLFIICEVILIVGFLFVIINETQKDRLNNIIKPVWLWSILGMLLTSIVLEFNLFDLITFTEKGLLKVWNIPQVSNFFVQEIKQEKGSTIMNPVSFNKEPENSFKGQKHIFIYDRTNSQIKNSQLDNIEDSLRKVIAMKLPKICNTLNNNRQNLNFINNLEYGDLIFLYTVIATYENERTKNLPINVITYLGHNKGIIDLKFVNDAVANSNECNILASCINSFKYKSNSGNQKSFYSLFIERVFDQSLQNETKNTILTIVGDFINEELNEENKKYRYEKHCESLGKILKRINNLESITEVRTIILPNTKEKEKDKFNITFGKFPPIFEKKLKKIRIDSLGGNLDEIIAGLTNGLKTENLIARFKEEGDNSYTSLNIKGGAGKEFMVKYLGNSTLKLPHFNNTPIYQNEVKRITLKTDTLLIHIPSQSTSKLLISQSGISIPFDFVHIKFTPFLTSVIILVILIVLFSLFFWGVLKHVYIPLYEIYKYHHSLKIPKIGISINKSELLAIWAASICTIYFYSIIQLFQL